MTELPDIEDLYPYLVRIKHDNKAPVVTLAAVKWLEDRNVMVNTDFFIDMQSDPERVLVRFRKKKHKKLFKENKKALKQEIADV